MSLHIPLHKAAFYYLLHQGVLTPMLVISKPAFSTYLSFCSFFFSFLWHRTCSFSYYFDFSDTYLWHHSDLKLYSFLSKSWILYQSVSGKIPKKTIVITILSACKKNVSHQQYWEIRLNENPSSFANQNFHFLSFGSSPCRIAPTFIPSVSLIWN